MSTRSIIWVKLQKLSQQFHKALGCLRKSILPVYPRIFLAKFNCVVLRYRVLDKLIVLFCQGAQFSLDHDQLVVFGNNVLIRILGQFCPFARREWVTRAARKKMAVLVSDQSVFFDVSLRAGEKFTEDAADGPHVDGLVVVLLGENDLWSSIPSRLDV